MNAVSLTAAGVQHSRGSGGTSLPEFHVLIKAPDSLAGSAGSFMKCVVSIRKGTGRLQACDRRSPGWAFLLLAASTELTQAGTPPAPQPLQHLGHQMSCQPPVCVWHLLHTHTLTPGCPGALCGCARALCLCHGHSHPQRLMFIRPSQESCHCH